MSRILRNSLLSVLLVLSVFLFLATNERDLPALDNLESDRESRTIISSEIDTGKQTLLKLAAHFPDEIIPVTLEQKVLIVSEVDNTPLLTSEVKYISTIVKSGTEHYYFKLLRTGRLITLTRDNIDTSWFILSIEKDFFILQSGEKQYKVLKK